MIMKSAHFYSAALILIALEASISYSHAQNSPEMINQVHHKAYVIDTHTDTPMKLIDGDFDPAERHEAPESRVDFPRLREGDVDAVFFAIFTNQRERTPENYAQAYKMAGSMLDSTIAAVKRNSKTVILAASVKEIIRSSKNNKSAICLGMENGFPLAKDIARIKEFYNRGVRYITLCHSYNNDICDSSTDPKGAENDGLSKFGKEVVAEMNRLGMIVDVSHISDKSFYDVLAVSRAPVIASHSSVRSLCDHPRNLSDDMIRELAARDGVIQICILGAYIVPQDTTSVNYLKHKELRIKYHGFQYKNDEERKAAWSEWDSIEKQYPPVLPSVAQAVDHIDHVVKLAGIDHVGIGSDFDGGGGLSDCTSVADYPRITAELLKRGYSPSDIAKIWGGNFLRVFRQVEEVGK